jgi:hypothetical protein
MKIQVNRLFQVSSKMVPAHANRELVREVELAREKAWCDAYLIVGGSY